MHKLKVVDGNKGYEKAYEETITYLKMKSVKKPELTPILFIEFDKLKDEVPFL